MDGVLFRGRSPLPGATEFLGWLTNRGIRFHLLTNNSTLTPEQNVAMLSKMSIQVAPEDVLSSSRATALYLKEQGARGDQAYVVGEDGLRQALGNIGIQIVDAADGVKWVVAGLDRHVTYRVLTEASFALERGATFIATNADASLPVEEGEAPGAGALQAALTATTGVHPLVIGKPEGRMLELGMKHLGGNLSNTAMLGDRLDTDIEAARRVRMTSILVLTGVTTPEQLDRSEVQPTLRFDDLHQLMRAWEG